MVDKKIRAEMEDYIEKKFREKTFDQTLLFVISSISILYMLTSLLFGIQGLLPLLPLLLSGFFMPFYIGYLRGSLIINTLEERVRGWIYFITGCGLYLSIIFIPMIYFLVGGKYYLSFILVIVIIILTNVILLPLIVIPLFVRAIQEIFRKSFNPYFPISIDYTKRAATMLVFIMLFLYLICIGSLPKEILYGLLFMPGAVYGFIGYEKDARRILEKPEKHFKDILQRTTGKSYIKKLLASVWNLKKRILLVLIGRIKEYANKLYSCTRKLGTTIVNHQKQWIRFFFFFQRESLRKNGDYVNTVSFGKLKNLKISELGGKAYSLAMLINNGFNVPKGFVIPAKVFFKSLTYNSLTKKIKKLTSEINMGNFKEKSSEIRDLILQGEISKDIATKVQDSLSELNAQYVSVRSSAASEDSLKAAFAGLYDTFLNIKVDLDLILEDVKRCWSSLFNERAVMYRLKKGIPHLEGIAVIVQEMVPAEVSGITFTVHPTGKNALLIEASYGFGDMIVGGEIEPDEYVIDRETLEIVDKNMGNKETMTICQNGKMEIVKVKEKDKKKPALSDDKITEIAKTCLKVEKLFTYPQDVEWSISKDKLWLLQSRAITTVIK